SGVCPERGWVAADSLAIEDSAGDGEDVPAALGRVDCRSAFISGQAGAGVRVFPLDRARVGGVSVEVATEFASQAGDRGDHAAGDDLAFDVDKPDLDLVEPRGIRRGEMKLHAR